MSLRDDALQMHKENQGKLEITPNIKVTNKEELSLAYSPGVAEPCKKYMKIQELYMITRLKEILWLLLLMALQF